MYDSLGKQSEEENNDESFVITGALIEQARQVIARSS
jgi:hypothetical protein